MDRYIRFVFITGVARFSRISIFSDLNNLNDISLEDAFSDICGWSERELIDNFTPGIKDLADKCKENFDTTLKELRDYYDGYLFTAAIRGGATWRYSQAGMSIYSSSNTIRVSPRR